MLSVTLKLNQVCIGKKVIHCRRIPHSMNHKMHFHARNKWNKAWQDEVGYALIPVRKKLGKLPLKYASIIITFYCIAEIDLDNMYTAAKPLVDALKIRVSSNKPGLGVIEDDKRKFCVWEVSWVPVKHRVDEHVEMDIQW